MVNLGDPADLTALPMLYVSWQELKRAKPIADRHIALILIPLGLAATLATSRSDVADPATLNVAESGSVAWAVVVDTETGETAFLSTEDGGRTFVRDRPSGVLSPAERDCAGATCYRIVPGELHVQRSNDSGATWTTAWRVSGGQYHDLINEYRVDHLASRSLAVIERPGGHVVLVANGRDGLLRRDESGTWTRTGRVERLSQAVVPGGAAPFSIAGTVALMLFAAVGTLAIRTRPGWWILLFEAGALAVAIGSERIVRDGDATPAPVVWAVSLLAVLVLAACLRLRPPHAGWAVVVAGITAATAWAVEALRRAGDDPVFGDVIEAGWIGAVLLLGFVLSALSGLGMAQKEVVPRAGDV